MNDCLEQLAEKRRSIYNLGRRPVMNEDEIAELVRHCVKFSPSAFNSQPCRVVVLFGTDSHRLWELTLAELKKVTPPERFAATETKIRSFDAGLGTILFFNDSETTANLQQKFPLYADKFPLWAEQASGILQYLIWTSFAEHDLGASLQHYNPLIDDAVKKAWNLPEGWKLIAQMPFGSIEAPADAKTFIPVEERVIIVK